MYAWVPPSVLGEGLVEVEPQWGKLPKINYLEFLTGLQRRNWTSKFYDENAVPWKLDFFKVACNSHGFLHSLICKVSE